MSKFYQGRFKPDNPQKYKGDASNIIYRSGWELKLMRYLDKHPHVTRWNSEEIIIPYRSPIDGKMHRYFPDFYVEKTYHGPGERAHMICGPLLKDLLGRMTHPQTRRWSACVLSFIVLTRPFTSLIATSTSPFA